MYTREENYRSRKTNKNTVPSFSSTLLDEIYRSIDGDEKTEGFKEKPLRKSGGGGSVRAKTKNPEDEDEDETASFRRACLVEKWMQKDEKVVAKRTPSPAALLPELDNNDLLFFSSTSSSSDSSGALSSSSDTEFFGSTTTKKLPKVSCFSTTRPKPVRTGVPARVETKPRKDNRFLFDDYNNNINNQSHQKSKVGDSNDLMIKSKSRALKIYANLKKVKQPISPGGKLTSFINSLFTNNASTKIQDSKSPSPTTCSSASSFSRSCLSKYSPKSREKMKNVDQRSVRFHPVSVIVDQDLKPCGKKSVYDDNYKKPPLPSNSFTKLQKNSKIEDAAKNVLRGYRSKSGDDFSVFTKFRDDDDDDRMSDSSSDLFELDHLAFFGDNRFCEELPVYETTRLDTNRGGVSRLIR